MKELKNLHHIENFLIMKWLPEEAEGETDPEKLRLMAYRNCYRTVCRHEKPVSRNTLRRWFGIESGAYPRREQIIRLAFAAHFTTDLCQEYLQEGIMEPGLQMNDYREVIFLYGLEHAYSYEECLDMITFFERRVNQDTVIIQRTHTEQIRKFYESSHLLEREQFLVRMCGHAEYFKEYSRVALKHFRALKTEIVEYAIELDRIELEKLLDRLDFQEWKKENKIDRVEKEDIHRFVRNMTRRRDSAIRPFEREEIKRLVRTVYMQKYTNAELLKKVYSLPVKKLNVFGMNQKKLYQILKIAENKEKEIRLSWALSRLNGCEDKKAPCPQQLCRLMERYDIPPVETVGAAEACLEKCLANQKQLCHLIRRVDLLPLIHYVAQFRYEQKNKRYHREEARQLFVDLANEILTDCQMAELNEEYRIDALFLSSYKRDEMDSFADFMEKMVWE